MEWDSGLFGDAVEARGAGVLDLVDGVAEAGDAAPGVDLGLHGPLDGAVGGVGQNGECVGDHGEWVVYVDSNRKTPATRAMAQRMAMATTPFRVNTLYLGPFVTSRMPAPKLSLQTILII